MIAELGGSDEMKKYIIAQYYLSECYWKKGNKCIEMIQILIISKKSISFSYQKDDKIRRSLLWCSSILEDFMA
jgi:hypothetical protein